MLSSRLLAASRRAGGMATATAARAASSLAFPHSDLSYRAILRNLRLLAGMRGDKKRFNVLVTGMAADEVASAMRDNEPCLDIQVAGDSRSADWDAIAASKGKDLDSVIVTQVYHVLRSPHDLKHIRACLHDEEGTAGFIWHRANNTGPAEAFGSAAASQPTLPGLHTPLVHGQSPIQWIEALDIDADEYKLKPLKHRKFVDRLDADAATLAKYLPLTHDARVDVANAAAVDAAVAAAASWKPAVEGEPTRLSLDLHAFHTAVIPLKKNAPMA